MIEYKRGYKYQLNKTRKLPLMDHPPIAGSCCIEIPLQVSLVRDSDNTTLTIYKGYAWDGPSGPTWDSKTFMQASLVHDALYQLMRRELLGREWRKYADDLMRQMCLEDGMWKVRAWWVWRGLRRFARFASLPSATRKIYRAP